MRRFSNAVLVSVVMMVNSCGGNASDPRDADDTVLQTDAIAIARFLVEGQPVMPASGLRPMLQISLVQQNPSPGPFAIATH